MSTANFEILQPAWRDTLRRETEKQMRMLSAVRQVSDGGSVENWGDTIVTSLLGKDICVRPYQPERIRTADSNEIVICAEHGSYFHFFVQDADKTDNSSSDVSQAACRLAADMDHFLVQTLIESDQCLDMRYVTNDKSVDNLARYLLTSLQLESSISLLFPTEFAARLSPEVLDELQKNSNLIVTDDLDEEIYVLKPEALVFFWKVARMEAYTPERSFCDVIKGLSLCGADIPDRWKVLRLKTEGVVEC